MSEGLGIPTSAPDRVSIGAAGVFVSVQSVASMLGTSEANVHTLLEWLSIPELRFPGVESKQYVLLFSLESALFLAGLPQAFRGDLALAHALQEMAGVMYGAMTREAVRQRVQDLAKALRRKDSVLTTTSHKATMERALKPRR